MRDAVVRPVSRASRSGTREPLCFKSLSTGATPQRCPFGRGVPKTAIAPTTSSQNGATPTPGIASRTSPGKSSRCQPSTTNNSTAVTTSIAHTIGGAKLAKAPMTSDTPAMRKATASRDTENLRGVEAVVSVTASLIPREQEHEAFYFQPSIITACRSNLPLPPHSVDRAFARIRSKATLWSLPIVGYPNVPGWFNGDVSQGLYTAAHVACHVRFGSKADMASIKRDVRFTPKSGHGNSPHDVRFVPKADS